MASSLVVGILNWILPDNFFLFLHISVPTFVILLFLNFWLCFLLYMSAKDFAERKLSCDIEDIKKIYEKEFHKEKIKNLKNRKFDFTEDSTLRKRVIFFTLVSFLIFVEVLFFQNLFFNSEYKSEISYLYKLPKYEEFKINRFILSQIKEHLIIFIVFFIVNLVAYWDIARKYYNYSLNKLNEDL